VEVSLEHFLYWEPVKEVTKPAWMLSGINHDGDRMKINLEAYLRPPNDPVITSDIDSIHYVSDTIPTTGDVAWTVHSSPLDNHRSNIHFCVHLEGEEVKLHNIPNIYVARFGQNSLFYVYLFFPGLWEKNDRAKSHQMTVQQRTEFYNKVFYPALGDALNQTNMGHVPITDYKAERRRTTDFEGHLRQAQILISNPSLQVLLPKIKELGGALEDKQFANPFYLISAKNLKLLTRSTEIGTEHVLPEKFKELRLAEMDFDRLYVDIGFEVIPKIDSEDMDYTLVWRASRLKVRGMICLTLARQFTNINYI
jgi:hypothetical protein